MLVQIRKQLVKPEPKVSANLTLINHPQFPSSKEAIILWNSRQF